MFRKSASQVIEPMNFIFRQRPDADAEIGLATRGTIAIGGMSHDEHLIGVETARVVTAHTIAVSLPQCLDTQTPHS